MMSLERILFNTKAIPWNNRLKQFQLLGCFSVVFLINFIPSHSDSSRSTRSFFIEASPLNFDILPGQSVCFFEYYPSLGSGLDSEALIEVFVGGKQGESINLKISGPFDDNDNEVPLNKRKDTGIIFDDSISSTPFSYDSFSTSPKGSDSSLGTTSTLGTKSTKDLEISYDDNTFQLQWKPIPGAYSFCFDNSKSMIKSKEIEVNIPRPDRLQYEKQKLDRLIKNLEGYEVGTEKDGKRNELGSQIGSKISQEDMTILQHSVDRISYLMDNIIQKQLKERRRLNYESAEVEANQYKLVMGSIVETTVFIAVSIFQLMYVRHWFAGKEKILDRRKYSRTSSRNGGDIQMTNMV